MKTSSIFSTMIFIIIFGVQSFSQTPVPGGPVNGTWTAEGSPYHIQGDISIMTGQSLVIEPGAWIEFQGHYKFNVQGSLLAQGAMNDTIMFTINDSTGFHDINIPDGGWHGIRFGFGSGYDSSRMSYCVFTFGKATGSVDVDKHGGAIAASGYSDLVITNSVFYMNAAQENGGAVALMDSDVTLKENQYWHNSSNNGGAIATNISSALITNSFFVDNHAENSGGAISLFLSSHAVIRTNLMAGNFADYGGAIQVQTNCNPMIQNNLIYSNVANEEGGGMDLEGNCQATLINNTIVGNFALFGGGIDVEDNTSPVFRNTILWGNTAFVDGPQIHLFSENSDPDFYYCDIEGGTDSIGLWYGGSTYLTYTGTYENNLDLDPVFYTQGDYLYLLDDTSPCIDAGDPDPAYNDLEDPDNPGYALWPSKGTTRNDIGAYGGPYPLTWDIITSIEDRPYIDPEQAVEQFRCFPNPACRISNFEFQIAQEQFITLTIYDLYGRKVHTILDEYKQAGVFTISFDACHLSPGIYLCTLQAEKQMLTRKLVISGR